MSDLPGGYFGDIAWTSALAGLIGLLGLNFLNKKKQEEEQQLAATTDPNVVNPDNLDGTMTSNEKPTKEIDPNDPNLRNDAVGAIDPQISSGNDYSSNLARNSSSSVVRNA